MSYLDEVFYQHLTSDLLLPKYKNKDNPFAGFCYIVTEVLKSFDHNNNYKVMHMAHEGVSHWFLARRDVENYSLGCNIVDPTNTQFKTRIHYENAKGKGFLTKSLSKRAKILQNRINKAIKNSDSYREANREWGTKKKILKSLQIELLGSLETKSATYAISLVVKEMEKLYEKTANSSQS